jgi:opacity protein-like surface antigen
VLAGGGVADVKQEVFIRGFAFGPDFPFIGIVDPPIPRIGTELSDTSLVLSAGAGIDYALTRHLGLGTSIRYQHVLSEPRSLDTARASVRVTWRF